MFYGVKNKNTKDSFKMLLFVLLSVIGKKKTTVFDKVGINMIFRELFNLNTCNQSPPYNMFKTLTHL